MKNLNKDWESLVTLQVTSDCCFAFRTIESENQDTFTFCTNLQKKKQIPYMELSADNDGKREQSLYVEKSRDNDQKRCLYK